MKKYYHVFMTMLVSFAFMAFFALPGNIAFAEGDDVISEEVQAEDWVRFSFEGVGSEKIINYSTSYPVDLEIGTQDCCILDDVVEIYIAREEGENCLIGVHESKKGEGFKYAYHTISLQPGNYVITLVLTESGTTGSSGWFYKLEENPYTGAYSWPCGFPGDLEIEAIEAKLDGLAGLPGMIERLAEAVAALETKSDAIEAKLDETSGGVQEKLDAIEAKLDEGAVITQDDLAAGQGGVYFMGAKNMSRPMPIIPAP